jgi:hypothetical protein
MKTIIAGSRSITSYELVLKAIEQADIPISEVVSGAARGVDSLGEQWAKSRGIKIKKFPAKWDLYKKSAGYKRNVEMAEYADALIAVWDGLSKGTRHMIDIAREKGLKVFVFRIKHEPPSQLPPS